MSSDVVRLAVRATVSEERRGAVRGLLLYCSGICYETGRVHSSEM